jgi:hypothetical protein
MSEKKSDSNGETVGHNTGLLADTGSKGATGLDLGLSALLDSLEGTPAHDSSASGSSSITDDRYHYYKSLTEAEAFSQLVRVTEEDFNKWGEGDLLARLFWIRANSRHGDFPRNMLAISLQKLIFDCTEKVSELSSEEEVLVDIRLAVGDISDQLDDSPELRKKILATYNDFVEAVEPSDSAAVVEDEPGQCPEPELPKDPWIERLFESTREGVSKYGVSALRGIILVFLPCFAYMLWVEFDRSGISTPLYHYIFGEDRGSQGLRVWHRTEFERVWRGVTRVASLQTPEVVRVKHLGDLEGLSYTFDEIGLKDTAPREEKPVTTASTKATSFDPQIKSSARPVVMGSNSNVTIRDSRARPVVDTSGPIEPYMVEPEPDRSRDDGQSRFPRRRNFVTEHFSSIRESGPPSRSDYYRIDVDTSVFSRPNLSARRLSDLSRGDRVLVEDDSGAWLTVRSKEGNIGFVSKRDAVPDWR